MSAKRMTRDAIDHLCWQLIRDRKPQPIGDNPVFDLEALSRTSCGEDIFDGLDTFLHSLYRYKDPRALARPPLPHLAPRHQAFLAGMAEWFAEFFGWDCPPWVDEPQYFLLDLVYDVVDEMGYMSPELGWLPGFHIETRAARMARTPPAFLRRGVVFETRNLIKV